MFKVRSHVCEALFCSQACEALFCSHSPATMRNSRSAEYECLLPNDASMLIHELKTTAG